jgi:hypothetical protein
MSNNLPEAEDDEYLESLKSSRKKPAVLKLALVDMMGESPGKLVFAFEGNDDKTVYYHWIKQLRPELKYLPFPCDGKDQILQLRDIVNRDLGEIKGSVYFFIDRDFDELRGRQPCEKVFMTEGYAIENYLVCNEVVEELLLNEFHCHLDSSERKDILAVFNKTYDDFLDLTNKINFKIFVARRLRIEISNKLPDKISKLAKINIDAIAAPEIDSDTLVKLAREPLHEELLDLEGDFTAMDRRLRYRGKFALLFFMKWLQELSNDRMSEEPKFFRKKLINLKVHFHKITLDSLACKAPFPVGLDNFLKRATAVG